jgi:hypothetical protein
MSADVIDLAATREERSEDITKRQDWLPEVKKEACGKWGRSENSDDPVTLEDLAALAMKRFEEAREGLRRVQFASKRCRARPEPARSRDRINRCGESRTKEIIDELEVVRLALVASEPESAHFRLNTAAKDIAAG